MDQCLNLTLDTDRDYIVTKFRAIPFISRNRSGLKRFELENTFSFFIIGPMSIMYSKPLGIILPSGSFTSSYDNNRSTNPPFYEIDNTFIRRCKY